MIQTTAPAIAAPVPVATEAAAGPLTLRVEEVVAAEGTAIVASVSDQNDAPPEGLAYVLARVTVTNTGQVLSTDASRADVSTLLPKGATLQSLIDRRETTLREVANSGETRLFTVVPVIPGLVYALGSWNLNSADVINISISRFTGILFPVALWAVSLAVAYFLSEPGAAR